jgi:translation initiation factor 2 subunit 2
MIESFYNDTNYFIDRAYNKLKIINNSNNKKIFIKPEILTHNRKTYIVNFIKYCDSINRDKEIVKKFLEKDMGALSSIISDNCFDEDTIGLKFTTIFKTQIVMNSITNYMKEYVLCKLCKSGNTDIKKIEKISYICCNNCKANNAI